MFDRARSFFELRAALVVVKFGLFLTESAINKFESKFTSEGSVENLDIEVIDFLSDLMVFKNFLAHIVVKNRNYINKKIESKIESVFERIDNDIYHCKNLRRN